MLKPLLLLISLAASAHGQLAITEFLASNSNSIEDENGSNEDWIEIQNLSGSPVNLSGWYLTDDASQPRRWAFPNWTLGGGKSIVVFASDKNRKPAQATVGADNTGAAGQPRLHTNFKLSADGEYLALTKDGVGGVLEIPQSFSPYPPQATDVSYGTQITTVATPILTTGAAVKYFVPTVANGGSALAYAAWTGAAASEPFAETDWVSGTTPVGFISAGVAQTGLKLRLNANSAAGVTSDSSPAGHDAANTGVGYIAADTDAGGKTRHGTLQFNATDSNGSSTGDLATVAAHADFNSTIGTISFWMRSAGVAAAGSEGGMLWDRRAGNGVGTGTVLYQLPDGRISMQAGNGGVVNQFASTVGLGDDRWHHFALVYNQASGAVTTMFVDGVQNASQAASGAWPWNNAQPIEIGRSHDPYWKNFNGQLDDVRHYNVALSGANITQIFNNADEPITPATNVLSAMTGVNPGIFLRLPFEVPDPAAFSLIQLTMNWTDGYVVWVNGVKVDAFAAPASPLYNSVATQTHAYAATVSVPVPASLLRQGTNILAIQGLNNTITNPYFAILPQLEGVNITEGVAGYLTSPTPGTANSSGKTNLGPFVSEVTNNPNPRPTGTAGSPALVISARVLPSLRPLAASNPVQLKYLVMFNAEQTVTMTDVGPAPGAPAGTRIYSGSIPTNTLGAGQMLRWRVVATDNTGVIATGPAYTDTADNEQYYGTVAVDNSITSNLPVIYWFTNNQAAAENTVGTRNSFFFKALNDPGVGRFYDNVGINLHGQSSSGFPKKSYNLDFNEDNRFVWDFTQKAAKDVDLLTNYGDKSKTHNVMAHEAFASIGSVAHWGKQVRIQQVTPANASNPATHFFSISDMLEDGDDNFLERNGRDPEGALYKVYDNLGSTVNAEKKTRKTEAKVDLQGLIDGLNPNNSLAARRLYAYDNMDLPQCVSYFVGCILTSHQDHGHKNYYVYRDTNISGEWSILPWDVDLTWGRTYQDNPGYFSDTMFVNNELDQYKSTMQAKGENRLYNLIVGNSDEAGRIPAPEFRDMVLRRLRTVLDGYFAAPTLENRFAALADLMDPPAIGTSDADRDFTKWPTWGTVGGATGGVALRYHISEITGPGRYLAGRRTFLNTATLAGASVPASQPANAGNLITIETVDFKPGVTQEAEFFVIRNSNAYAVDLSNWQLTGAVQMTIKPGTILPPGGGVTENLGDLYVVKNPITFRARPTVTDDGQPAASRYRFVQGPYSGQLSARGETLELRNPAGVLVKTKTWTPAPTPAQDQLRVTELNYAPAGPTLEESTNLAGVTEGDFEYIELQNIGATPLVLTGARFTSGISFTFPARTLAAGERVLVVANLAAFQLRYGTGLNAQIAGTFEGNLNNDGENLQLVDNIGENILDFTYSSLWFPPSDEGGRTLVVRDAQPVWSAYGSATSWALSGQTGGSPGTPDTSLATVYEGWRHSYFAEADFPTPIAPEAPAALLSDADFDGLNNLTEYAFGRIPTTPDNNAPLTEALVVADGGSEYLAVTFTRQRSALDLLYIVEACDNLTLGNWQPITTLVGSPIDQGGGLEEVTFRDSVARTGEVPRFIRVRAVK